MRRIPDDFTERNALHEVASALPSWMRKTEDSIKIRRQLLWLASKPNGIPSPGGLSRHRVSRLDLRQSWANSRIIIEQIDLGFRVQEPAWDALSREQRDDWLRRVDERLPMVAHLSHCELVPIYAGPALMELITSMPRSACEIREKNTADWERRFTGRYLVPLAPATASCWNDFSESAS